MARLYWRIAEATGWTYPEIDEMHVSDADEMTEQWRNEPPLPVCVRQYLGVRPAEPDQEEQPDDGSMREITEEEWKAKCEREKAYAAEQNGRRNPFL